MSIQLLADELMSQGWIAEQRGNYQAARAHYEEVLACYNAAPNSSESDLAHCWQRLGIALCLCQQGDAAHPYLQKAREAQRNLFGNESLDLAEILYTLGELRLDQEDYDGLDLINQAYLLRLKLLGPYHPVTLATQLPKIWFESIFARPDYTFAPIQNLLEHCEGHKNSDNPATAEILNALGNSWGDNSYIYDYEKARQAYERALDINRRHKGGDHPDTLDSLTHLAVALVNLKKYTIALPLLKQSLILHQRRYGKRNFRIPYILHHLGKCYKQTGQLNKALRVYTERLIIEEQFIEKRPRESYSRPIIFILRELLVVSNRLSRKGYTEATVIIPSLQHCLKTLELSHTRPGTYFWQTKRNTPSPEQAALELHQLVIQLETRFPSPPYSLLEQSILHYSNKLVESAQSANSVHSYKTLVRLRKALQLQEKILGTQAMEHIPLLKAMAFLRESLGHPEARLPLYQRIVDLYLTVPGAPLIPTLQAQTELIRLYAQKYGAAATAPLRERLIPTIIASLGPDDPLSQSMQQQLQRIYDPE